MIVVIKDLYTLKSWEDQDTESLAFHLNNKKIWDMPASSSNKRRRKQIYRIFVLRLVARLLVTLVL